LGINTVSDNNLPVLTEQEQIRDYINKNPRFNGDGNEDGTAPQ
jgi:hypothetical protein